MPATTVQDNQSKTLAPWSMRSAILDNLHIHTCQICCRSGCLPQDCIDTCMDADASLTQGRSPHPVTSECRLLHTYDSKRPGSCIH